VQAAANIINYNILGVVTDFPNLIYFSIKTSFISIVPCRVVTLGLYTASPSCHHSKHFVKCIV
jgi:hypothetical protein